MRILIMGGTGEISRYVVKKYRDNGHQVIVLNRGNKKELQMDTVEYRRVDTNNRDELYTATKDYFYDKILDFTTFDADIMKIKIELLQKRCYHYIFISSVAAYERKENIECYTEDMDLGNSQWIYGYKKGCCEKVLREMYNCEKKHYYTIIRPGITYSDTFIPYSPIDTYNMPGYLIHCILEGKEILTTNKGEDKIQILHSCDFAENLYMLLSKERSLGAAFNISGDEYVTSNQIINELVNILGKQAIVCYIPEKEFKGKLEPLVEGGWHDVYSNYKVKTLLENYHSKERLCGHLQQIIDFSLHHQDWMLWSKDVEKQIQMIIENAKKERKIEIRYVLSKKY